MAAATDGDGSATAFRASDFNAAVAIAQPCSSLTGALLASAAARRRVKLKKLAAKRAANLAAQKASATNTPPAQNSGTGKTT